MPYLTLVKDLVHEWKPLRYFADFMEVGTTPLRWKDLKTQPDERKARIQRTNVTYIECRDGRKKTVKHFDDAGALRQSISSLATRSSTEKSTHIFLMEDLSRDVVEALGSTFHIDPFFFREQIDDYTWYNTRDPWQNPPSLMAAIENRDWFRLRNVRLNYFETKELYEQARQESNMFNVLRRPDDDQNHWKYLDKAGSIVTLTRTKTSIWTGKTGVDNNIDVGVVLIDPTVSSGAPLWHGSTNWLPTPSAPISDIVKKPRSTSLFGGVIEKTASYPWFARTTQQNASGCEPAVIAKPILYTVAAEWLSVCDYVKARLGQIEWELEKPGDFRAAGDRVDASLKRLHVWRRVIPVYRDMVSETLQQALPAATRLLSESDSLADPLPARGEFEDIAQDYRRIQDSLNEIQTRVDRLTAIVTSEISIEDSRRGLQENHNLARLTWMATTFIPLSFVTGLFSMQADLSELKHTYGWYFAAAIPLTILVMVASRQAGSISQWRNSKRVMEKRVQWFNK